MPRKGLRPLDILRVRNDNNILRTKSAQAESHALKMTQLKNVNATTLGEIAEEGGAVYGPSGIPIDTYGVAMTLNSYALANGVAISDFLPIPTDVLSHGGQLVFRLSGTIVNNSGAAKTLLIKSSPSLNGTSTFSPTNVHGTADPEVSVATGSAIKMWECTIRVRRAGDLDPTRLVIENSMRVDGVAEDASILYDCSSNLDSLGEITHFLFGAYSSESNPVLLITADTLSMQVLGDVAAPYYRWISIAADHPYDAYIRDTSPTTNFGSQTNLYVGESNAATQVNRSLLKFPALDYLLAAYPNAIVEEAELVLTIQGDLSSNNRTMNVYPILLDWTESGVTWNSRDGTNAWNTAGLGSGTDRGATSLGSYAFGPSEVVGNKQPMPLIAAEMQKYFDGTYSNHGFLLQMDTELNDANFFDSADSLSYHNAPLLYIRFSIPN